MNLDDENIINLMNNERTIKKIFQSTGFSPTNGTDYVEFYVGNASNSTLYKTAFGFQSLAYSGLEQETNKTLVF